MPLLNNNSIIWFFILSIQFFREKLNAFWIYNYDFSVLRTLIVISDNTLSILAVFVGIYKTTSTRGRWYRKDYFSYNILSGQIMGNPRSEVMAQKKIRYKPLLMVLQVLGFLKRLFAYFKNIKNLFHIIVRRIVQDISFYPNGLKQWLPATGFSHEMIIP